jgi:hypothetical protein
VSVSGLTKGDALVDTHIDLKSQSVPVGEIGLVNTSDALGRRRRANWDVLVGELSFTGPKSVKLAFSNRGCENYKERYKILLLNGGPSASSMRGPKASRVRPVGTQFMLAAVYT